MSDDSFFNNPTVQQILQKQGIFDNEQSTADFIKDLLIGSIFNFGTSYFQALPGAKQEAINGIRNNINEALGDDKISWADNTSYRNDYQKFANAGGKFTNGELNTEGKKYLEEIAEANFKKDVYDESTFKSRYGSLKQARNAADPEFNNTYLNYIESELAELKNTYNNYSQNRYISTHTFKSLADDTRNQFAEQLKAAKDQPGNLFELIGQSIEKNHGKKNAAIVKTDVVLDNPETRKKADEVKRGAEVLTDTTNIADSRTFNELYEQVEDKNMVLAATNVERKEKIDKHIKAAMGGRKNEYRDYSFDIRPTNHFQVVNGQLIDVAPNSQDVFQEDAFYLFRPKALNKMVVKEYNPKTGERVILNVNGADALRDSLSSFIAPYQEKLNMDNDVAVQQATQAFLDAGIITHDGTNLVFNKPRADRYFYDIPKKDLSSLSSEGKMSILLTGYMRQQDKVAPDAFSLYDKFQNEEINKINQLLVNDDFYKLTVTEQDNLVERKSEINNQDEISRNRDAIKFLFQPPEEYQGTLIKGGSRAGEITKDKGQLILDDFEEATGQVFPELQEIVDSLPEPKPIEIPTEVDDDDEGGFLSFVFGTKEERLQKEIDAERKTMELFERLGKEESSTYKNAEQQLEELLQQQSLLNRTE